MYRSKERVKMNNIHFNIISSLRKLNTETAHFAIERIKVRLVGSDNLLMKAIKLKQFLLPKFESKFELTLKTQFFIMNHQQVSCAREEYMKRIKFNSTNE
ncbi:Hypothetical_protein [Hexamita inflata]|uniref:Hypothetical_protein n=1 Tax=Hexamita inflata TaxID=28002 RepID=A0AA86R573_9EUKA|nr:Hypothetical protein HINF_LOCUS56713 [Hexamita inflata]